MAAYIIYVDNKQVHECSEWHEAHTTFTQQYGIDENIGLPIYTSIDGVPTWGTTPEEQANPKMQRRLKTQRTRYLKSLQREA